MGLMKTHKGESDVLRIVIQEKNSTCLETCEWRANSTDVWSTIMRFARTTKMAIVCIAFILFLQGVVAVAQGATGDILGTVTDPQGATVPGAAVALRNLGTNAITSVVTAADGNYSFSLLQPGTYSVTVTATGWETLSVPSVTIAAGDRARVNAQMHLGAATENVTVEAIAPALQTDSSQVSTTVEGLAAQNLPLNGRNFINLVEETPGVEEGVSNSLSGGNRPDDRRQTSSIAVNGQYEGYNNEMIDGMDNNDRVIGTLGVRPSVEAISELHVVTSNYPADVGRTPGGAVDVITRGGTNSFHGSVYEFLRNDKLDAYPYAFGGTGVKPPLHQNQYGASVGGPIIHNKTFFFGDFEGYRLATGGNPQVYTVPTLYEEEHVGDFSDIGGSVLTAQQLDSVGENYFALYPAPNSGSSTFVGLSKKTQFSQVYDGRIDHSFSFNDNIYVRYTGNFVDSNYSTPLPAKTVAGVIAKPGGATWAFLGPATNDADNAEINYTHAFTPRLLTQLQASYTYIHNLSSSLNGGTNVSAAFGIANVNTSSLLTGLTPLQMVDAASLGDSPYVPIDATDNTFEYMGSVTYSRGKHAFKVGAGLIRRQSRDIQSSYPLGTWVVLDLPSLLEGNFETLEQNINPIPPNWRFWEPSFYAIDNWRLNRKLTLNLGLRYDIFGAMTEVKNRISNFNLNTATIQVAGVNGVSKSAGIDTDHSNLAPRLGFAYSVTPNTVVRGSFGMTFYPGSTGAPGNLKNQPFVETYLCTLTPADTCPTSIQRMADGFPVAVASSATNPAGVIPASRDPHFPSSYQEQFNLAVQKDLSGNVVMVGYIGMLGRHVLAMMPDLNAAPPNTAANPNLLRPYYVQLPNVTEIESYSEQRGVAAYHALQLSLERRLRSGLGVMASYVWSHNEDADPINNNGSEGEGTSVALWNQREWGNSDLDSRNHIAGTVNYSLPFGKTLSGVKKTLAAGWQVNGLYAWSTGTPSTVVNSYNVSNTEPGENADRPNQIASPKLSGRGVTEWFNTAAFQVQATGTIGTERRNQIFGPNSQHLDMSLFKDFTLPRESTIEFRIEGFNVLNRTSFGSPNLTLGSSAFGQIQSLGGFYNPRVLQVAAKFDF